MAILVVEDERRVRAFVARGLSEEGFTVVQAEDGTTARARMEEGPFQLVLLDWMLPGMSGLELLEGWRDAGNTVPVIMLTARDELDDRLAALNAGADDYLVKPFAFEELLARVRAVLRRVERRQIGGVLRCGDLELDNWTRRVSRAGQDVRLTAREFALLRYLLEHQGEVVPRTRIVQAVWEHDYETFSNVVEVYIRYLRAKIDEPFGKRLIHTVRGVGYVLREEP